MHFKKLILIKKNFLMKGDIKMRKKMLFIVPPCVGVSELMPDENRPFSSKIRKEIPLGVLTLATYMKSYTNAEVAILDLNLKFYELVNSGKINNINTPEMHIKNYIRQLKDEEYDFCGISSIFGTTFGYINIISRIIKEVFPKAIIFTGGGVPSNLMREVFDSAPCVDIISYAEGEIAISGFVNAENEQEYVERSASLMTREKLEKGFQYSYEFIEDLDEIPPLDFSLIDFEKYYTRTQTLVEKKVISIPFMFSRGCPFNCCFCSSHSIHGKRVRYTSLERIKSDIKKLVDEYHVNTIAVEDDNFFIDKDKAIALLKFFMEMNLALEFKNGFPVYRIDDEMASILKSSGVDVVTLAIESGNPRVLKDIIHKPLKLEMVSKAVTCLHKYDIYVQGLFLIGFPGETLDDIQITMDFIHNSELNWISIFIAAPLPGSELYDICKKEGYLKNNNFDALDYWSGNIETEYFNTAQIEDLQVYNTIKKDFVNNLDMKNENWERALFKFEYVIKENFENPFSYYYAAKAAEKLGKMEKAQRYFDKYQDIRKNTKKWEPIFERFVKESVEFPVIGAGGC